jgi:hypothetical protein
LGYGFTEEARHYTIALELMGPLNRIVVVHQEPKLCLIGARDMRTQKEIPATEAAKLLTGNIPVVKSFPLQSIHDIIVSFNTMNPLQQEGYVVVDANFNRIKVKHPGYVALHHAKDGLNTKAFVEIARKGEVCEVITAFPEFEPLLLQAKEKVDAFVQQIQVDYDNIKHIPEQKAFALEAVKTCCSSAMFSMRIGTLKVTNGTEKLTFQLKSARDYVAYIRIDTLMEYLGL